MGWIPAPRFDKRYKCFYCRLRGEYHYLGTDYAAAHVQFAALYRRAYGESPPATSAAPLTVPELVEQYLSEFPSERTRWMLRPWALFEAATPVASLSPECLASLLRELQKAGFTRRKREGKRIVTVKVSYKPATLLAYLAAVRSVLGWARRRGWLGFDVPDLPKLPKPLTRPRDLSTENVGKLVSALSHKACARALQVVRFCLATGCRPGEAVRLRWGDVDIARAVATIDSHKTSHRSGVGRTIYLNSDAVAVLKEVDVNIVASKQAAANTYVFLSRLGRPYTVSGLRSILRSRGALPNMLRHTFAQHALETLSPDEVGELLGHTDRAKRSVKTYAQIRSARLQRVVKTLVSPVRLALGDESTPGTAAGVPAAKTKRRAKQP